LRKSKVQLFEKIKEKSYKLRQSKQMISELKDFNSKEARRIKNLHNKIENSKISSKRN